jgi:hypothetical protein
MAVFLGIGLSPLSGSAFNVYENSGKTGVCVGMGAFALLSADAATYDFSGRGVGRVASFVASQLPGQLEEKYKEFNKTHENDRWWKGAKIVARLSLMAGVSGLLGWGVHKGLEYIYKPRKFDQPKVKKYKGTEFKEQWESLEKSFKKTIFPESYSSLDKDRNEKNFHISAYYTFVPFMEFGTRLSIIHKGWVLRKFSTMPADYAFQEDKIYRCALSNVTQFEFVQDVLGNGGGNHGNGTKKTPEAKRGEFKGELEVRGFSKQVVEHAMGYFDLLEEYSKTQVKVFGVKTPPPEGERFNFSQEIKKASLEELNKIVKQLAKNPIMQVNDLESAMERFPPPEDFKGIGWVK